jgi:hypothetical protein
MVQDKGQRCWKFIAILVLMTGIRQIMNPLQCVAHWSCPVGIQGGNRNSIYSG